MDPEKLVGMQRQMQRNNNDLQDFLTDMERWEKDIKNKDGQLQSEKQDQPKLPPVRNSLTKKKVKAKASQKKQEASKSGNLTNGKKLATYDYYDKWDKFNINKALEDIDSSEGENRSSSEYETDEEAEAERYRNLALLEKDKGNECFKGGKYNEAIECYTTAMKYDPENPVLPANRAMALLKLNKFGAAEADCTASISLDPLYIKAYARRASAYFGLDKFAEALQDYHHVLKLEPKNKLALKEVDRIGKILYPESYHEEEGVVKAVFKPPNQRSKKPLRRIMVEEVGKSEVNTSQTKPEVENICRLQPKVEKQNMSTKKDNSKVKNAQDTQQSISHRTVGNNSHDLKSEAQTKERSFAQASPKIPDIPQTSFQFQADYKLLKQHPQAFYEYFKSINPLHYTKLFGESMESEILSSIISILKTHYTRENDAYSVLLNLCNVKRFSMTTMFLSSSEKSALKEVFSNTAHHSAISSEELNSVSKKYGL